MCTNTTIIPTDTWSGSDYSFEDLLELTDKYDIIDTTCLASTVLLLFMFCVADKCPTGRWVNQYLA